MKVLANGIAIEVEDSGADGGQQDRPVVMLVMGLGMQLIAWPPAMLRGLIDAGYRVIRHDNRDIGLSAQLEHLGRPSLVWEGLKFNFGLNVRAPYSLQDMADDALGVLDALGVARAHVVGVSMGGMIAQRMAIAAPQRVRSLVSIMSSSGARDLPKASARVQMALLRRPGGQDEDEVVRHYQRLFQVIGSPGYALSPADIEANVRRAVRRCYRPDGVARQTLASISDADRAQALAAIRAPTLVLHGKDDPLVPYACGVDTARRIPGARLQGFAGMGHDLAPGVVDLLMGQLLPHLAAT
jgi:pimeloyl-ACP methyl ester carboxylesterase